MLSLFNKIEDNLLQKYLLIEISKSFYAFKIAYVREIIPIIEMFTVEALQNNITGLINLRGETITVYDLRGFLGKDLTPLNVSQKLLILMVENKKFAIIIDNVGDIINITEENITPLDYNQTLNFLSTAVIDNDTVIITDAEKFLKYADNAQNVKKIASGELIPTVGNSITKVKNRTALLNKSINYNLSTDTFLDEKFIIFRLGEEFYSFNISYIKEIKKLPLSAISKIPCVPDFVMGIINFRGDYLSLLDIKTFLNMPVSQLKEKMDIVILKINMLKVAVLVDEILDISSLPIATMNPETDSHDSYIIGEILYKDGKLLNMLNIEKLFSSENVNIENYE